MCTIIRLQDKDNFISTLIYFIGFSTSIIALLIALFIFIYFRYSLDRITALPRSVTSSVIIYVLI